MSELRVKDELETRDNKNEVKNVKNEIEDASRLRFES